MVQQHGAIYIAILYVQHITIHVRMVMMHELYFSYIGTCMRACQNDIVHYIDIAIHTYTMHA